MAKTTICSDSERALRRQYGCCPECGRIAGLLHISTASYAVCLAHRAAWFAGVNLDPHSVPYAPDEWTRNAILLSHFRIICDELAKLAAREYEEQARIDDTAAELLNWLDLD
jgi:hypothetical protein